MSTREFFAAPVKMSGPTANWASLMNADRPEWEREEGEDHPGDQEPPPTEAPPSRAPRDFEPHAVPAPYKRTLGYPYVSRERFVPNPQGLNPTELAALNRFFETRQA